jgi:hypothetical protein
LFYRGILKSKDTEDLTAEHMEQVIQVTHLWISMEEQRKNPANFKNAVTRLMKVLGDSLQAPAVDIHSKGRWVGVLLDTSRTFANTYLPDKLAFAFHPRGAPQEEDLPELTDLLTVSMRNQPRVVLPMWCDRNILERTRTLLRNKFQQAGAIDTVILDIDQAQDIVAAVRPEVKLHHVVLSQISLARIDPYVNRGPTTQRVFFGRENELREITQKVSQANFAIIGGRRYGKTSILNQLYEVRLPKDTFHSSMKVGHSRGCYAELLALLKKMPKDLPLVLLLDEADTIIEQDADKNWELFNHLRALSNEHKAHFILAGERQLRSAIHHDSKSPLFNLANEIALGPLDFHSVQELVLSPMKQLELEFEDEQAIVNAIWQFTAGHPSVVQSLCKRLIHRLNDQGSRRITLEDVQAVIEDRRFQQEDFLETYWEQATPLEVLITLLMAGNEKLRNQADIGEALEKRCHILPTAQQVDEALTRLVVLRAILVSTSDGYQFKVPAFARVAAGMLKFENPLKIYADMFRKVGE